jgi:transaldolase
MDTMTMSPLLQTVSTTPTDYWNDSCAVDELAYAIEHGAVGATTNPTIVLDVLRKDPALWRERARALWRDHEHWNERDLAWAIIEELGVRGAEQLLPVFEREGHRKGRISMQTDPTQYRNPPAMVEQGVHFATLAPNVQVKFPATKHGLQAIEEATYRGVNINATVNFTVPQALAVGEAVERALRRRDAEGLDTSEMSPVCTIMIGRLDDWMKAICDRDDIIVNPGFLDWAGIAALKKAYAIFQERGYRTRLLSAAYRNHLHWSELIGGDVILTIPYQWQRRFNASKVEVRPRFDEPVDPAIVAELYDLIPDFRRAYDEDGLAPDDFDGFGATVRTLRGFIASYHELQAVLRDFVLPNPDKR